MRPIPFPISLCLLASAGVLVSSCGDRQPAPELPPPPADLFARPPYPEITPRALVDERAYERWREDQADWGKALDAGMYEACRWVRDTYHVPAQCGAAPAWREEARDG